MALAHEEDAVCINCYQFKHEDRAPGLQAVHAGGNGPHCKEFEVV